MADYEMIARDAERRPLRRGATKTDRCGFQNQNGGPLGCLRLNRELFYLMTGRAVAVAVAVRCPDTVTLWANSQFWIKYWYVASNIRVTT